MSFLGSLFKVKAEGAFNAGVRGLVKLDPKAATEAQLRVEEDKLKELCSDLAKARSEYEKENTEAVQARALFEQRKVAAKMLAEQVEADPSKQASLDTLLNVMEKSIVEVEREEAEAKSAKEYLDQIEEVVSEFTENFKTVRAELEAASREMSAAARTRQMEEDRAERSKKLAGFTSTGTAANPALQAMKEAAERDRIAATAAKTTAEVFGKSKTESSDANIEAAMRAASGKAAAPTDTKSRLGSLLDR